uniref:Uncharacterized protein n=1 Tax=Haptolina ericina TaxID=156174 RepID=A0A7S3AWI4_9EUKA
MLDRAARSVAKCGSRRFVATKLLLELAVLHPIFLLAFFGSVGLASGDEPTAIRSQIAQDLLPTLGLEWALWAPIDGAVFAVVPVRHQVLVINAGCFVESVGLSFIKANGITLPGEHSHEDTIGL